MSLRLLGLFGVSLLVALRVPGPHAVAAEQRPIRASAGTIAELTADRLLVERVYYNHRLGDKPPFESLLSRQGAEALVRGDLRKEDVLRRVYGCEISADNVGSEVRRIDASTRAPAVLAELRASLADDPARFARAVARPMVVERELRRRFEDDAKIHADQRARATRTREAMLAARPGGLTPQLVALRAGGPAESTESTWRLGPRTDGNTIATQQELAAVQKQFGTNAHILATPGGPGDRRQYFADLPAPLQTVLDVQLRQASDVTAVIETPGDFRIYLAEERSTEAIKVAVAVFPKRGYEEWVVEAGRTLERD